MCILIWMASAELNVQKCYCCCCYTVDEVKGEECKCNGTCTYSRTHTHQFARYPLIKHRTQRDTHQTTVTSCVCLCVNSLFDFIWSCLVLMIGVLFHSCEFHHMQGYAVAHSVWCTLKLPHIDWWTGTKNDKNIFFRPFSGMSWLQHQIEKSFPLQMT